MLYRQGLHKMSSSPKNRGARNRAWQQKRPFLKMRSEKITRPTQSERQQAEETRSESRRDKQEAQRLREELEASDRNSSSNEPLEGREQALTDKAARATASAEQIRKQTEEHVAWNNQITEGWARA